MGLMVLSVQTFAAETDQFTKRNAPLEDSAPLLNSKANKAIASSLKNLNNENAGCNEKLLYKELRKYFANHLSGRFVIDLIENDEIPKIQIDLNDSVFQDWQPWDGLGLGLILKRKSDVVMSPEVNIGGHKVGTDKFEHMFGQGFKYFTVNYLEGKGVRKAVSGGTFRERYMLGGAKLNNGLFSFGDLSANFNGMRFWNHMLQLRDDVLGADHNIGPYIACQNNEWKQVKDLDLTNYIDESMDEGINCSQFPTKKTAAKYKARVKASGLNCPVEPDKLQDMVVKYRHMSKWIINTEGNGVIEYADRFKSL
jgi:hypothetical protein